MNATLPIVAGLVGLLIGSSVVWLAMRTVTARLEEQLAAGQRRSAQETLRAEQAQAEVVRLQAALGAEQQERAAGAARLQEMGQTQSQAFATLLEQAKNELGQAQRALVDAQRKEFLELAGQRFERSQEVAKAALSDLVSPVREKLVEFDGFVRDLEKQRAGAAEGLKEQIAGLVRRTESLESAANRLTGETSSLVRALRDPTTRGKWGEMQLRRVVELAGMERYCDFETQQSFSAENGALRPDLAVHLPEQTLVLVDAKTPLGAYLDAMEALDDTIRAQRLKDHALTMKAHVDALARKDYRQIEGSVDFVVMFVPGEAFLSAACTENPALIEYAAARNVFLTSPLSLIALLRSYAQGWQRVQQTENAQKIAKLGRELYESIDKFAELLGKLRKSLLGSINATNELIGSYEGRLLPRARNLGQQAALDEKELPEVAAIDEPLRPLASERRSRLTALVEEESYPALPSGD